MIRLRYRWHAACPRHPRYQPSRGRGAIKAGCPCCYELWKVYEAAQEMERHMNAFERLADERGRLLDLNVRRSA